MVFEVLPISIWRLEGSMRSVEWQIQEKWPILVLLHELKSMIGKVIYQKPIPLYDVAIMFQHW